METAGNKEFDEDTEKKGLGTPATRAGIIEKLIYSQYATRKGKQILPTDDGKVLVEILPDFLKSAGMTAEWENQLLLMEHGEIAPEQFMTGIKNMLTMMLNGCDAISEEETRRFLENTGFVVGGNVTVVSEIDGNLIVNVKDSRVAVGKDMAAKILI